jgi:predicted ATPase/transcriptional regulator with XRE-family HTH domain/Tfp pilus assembly protein PilF
MVASPATFGDRLRRYRLAAGLTQEELAERAQVSPRAISDLERGLRSRPWRDTVQFLAEALHLSASERSELELAARRPGPAPTEPVARSGIDLGARRSNLPTPPTRLIGRDTETAHVGELLRRSDVRLVTLTGPGGIGKTQLALQVATDLLAVFPGGIYFVPLAPIGEPSLVLPTIAQILGVKESAGQPLADILTDALRERSALLLLDNFEHVVAAAASVSDLLAHCPQVKILVTSRSPLHLRGEHESPVPPLRLPNREHHPPPKQALEFAAVQLFAERAQAVKPDFAVTSQNVAAVAEICRRLDGLPLAIELATARIKVLSPADILNRLGDRLRILTGGARDLPARQQSLRNTIAWSYDMLDEGEKTLFRHLAVFTGGCTLEAAEVVCCELPIDVLDGLTSLVDHSMLQRDETRGDIRFSMLETIHEYGRALLMAGAEGNVVSERHAAYFLGLVEEVVRLDTSEGPQSWLSWQTRLEPERANLRAALAWCQENNALLGLRLAAGLGWFWIWHHDLREGEGWLATFLARTVGDSELRGRALLALATLMRDRGDLAAAQPLFEESLALCRQAGDRWGIGRGLGMLAQQARSAADYERGIALAQESLAIARELHVLESIIFALNTLGQIYRLQANFGRARAILEEALRLSPGNLEVLYRLGRTAEDEGEYNRAEALFQEGLALEQRTAGDVCGSLLLLGRLARKQGDRVRARRLSEEGLAVARPTAGNVYPCWALYYLAELDWGDDDPINGHARLAEGLRLALFGRNRQVIALGLLVGAKHAAEYGALVRAIRLFGAAERAMPRYEFEQDAFELGEYDRSLKEARAALTPEAFASAWAEGHAMTAEQAIALALDVSGG